MLISCDYIKYLGYDKATDKYRYQYKIVDTEFEEVGVGVGVAVEFEAAVEVGVEVGVIETYRKRNLPVVPNLIRAWQYHTNKYGYSMQQIVSRSKQYNPYFAEYEDEINKYLLLQ
jgi:hypothetical protein